MSRKITLILKKKKKKRRRKASFIHQAALVHQASLVLQANFVIRTNDDDTHKMNPPSMTSVTFNTPDRQKHN